MSISLNAAHRKYALCSAVCASLTSVNVNFSCIGLLKKEKENAALGIYAKADQQTAMISETFWRYGCLR